MAESGNVGKLNVEIGANTVPLKAALKEAEASTKQAAATIGEAAAQVGTKVEKEVGEKVSKTQGLVSGLKKTFQELLLPVSLFTGLSAIVSKIVEARKEMYELQAAMENVGTDFARIGQGAAQSDMSPLEKELKRVDDAAAVAKEKLDALLQAEEDKRGTAPGALWSRMWRGSIDDITARHDEAMNRIYGQQQRNRERAFENDRAARAKAAAEADAKMWDDLAAQRDKADKAALEAIEDRRKANEKAMQEQIKANEAMTKMAGQYAAELSAAFSGAVASNRAASDAMMERMATSVNRLKEIAESNRQAQNRGDTSTAGGVW